VDGWLAIALAALALALPARAELVADRDYVAIVPAQVTDNPAKTEVLEFFSYGCPHCADFHPLVSKWATRPCRAMSSSSASRSPSDVRSGPAWPGCTTH
jgi:hypothetical protein